MTNLKGHVCASLVAEQTDPPTKYSGITLGAYRRGKSVCIVPGAVIDIWTPCARQLSALGFEEGEGTWPHAFFIETIGGTEPRSIYCPGCRDKVERRPRTAAPVKKPTPQLSLF